MPSTLILLRHGESDWNRANLFTGWVDSDLSPFGEEQARQAGQVMLDEGVEPTVVHTSLQVRAIRTANLALDVMERLWLPVRRSWRLNERHYGDLTGKDKKQTVAEFGEEQVKLWRRSYDTPPPPIRADNPHNPNGHPAWAHLPAELVPLSECLKDVVARVLPWYHDQIITDLAAGEVVLVAAHGNSLRALVKHLKDIPDEQIVDLEIPTGVPWVLELDDDLRVVADRWLGDPEAARAKAEAVARQASQPRG